MDESTKILFSDWMHKVTSAARRLTLTPDDIYYGEEGCKRLARECGCAIPDFISDKYEQDQLISSTYSCICVIVYNLKPPVDAKEWIKNMKIGRDRALEVRYGA